MDNRIWHYISESSLERLALGSEGTMSHKIVAPAAFADLLHRQLQGSSIDFIWLSADRPALLFLAVASVQPADFL